MVVRTRKSKSSPVGVVSKVVRILELLGRSPSGLQLKDIAQVTAINKSTAYRFLSHLASEGYLFRDQGGSYTIGPRLVHLGSGVTYQTMLRRISRPVLEQIWRTTGETVNLGVLAGHEVIYIDVLESTHTFRLVAQVGWRRPVYSTSLGKAMLGFLPADQREDILATAHLERITQKTITSLPRLRKELAQIQQQGYALDDEETLIGARGVGAPFFDAHHVVAGSISVSGPTVRLSTTKLPAIAATIRAGAAEISQRLGYVRTKSE